MDVTKAVVGLITIAWGVVSPRVSTRDEVTAIFRRLADEGASSVSRTVTAGAD